jgi:hypothetical protein
MDKTISGLYIQDVHSPLLQSFGGNKKEKAIVL